MDIVLVIIGFILIIAGIVGSILPVLPGPITSWFGLLLLYLTDAVPMNYTMLVGSLILALFIFILDYFIPGMGAKKFGGSKYGVVGTTIGLIIGILFFPPFGIIIGPFLGAFIGELIFGTKTNIAIKAAFGSLLGLLTSTFLKLLVAICFAVVFFWKLVQYSSELI
jgi:hypothetical protein|tara:strand:- start:2947 stop:3444 length:498 start_codon:yes stop_codon:yes gene_type:complete